MWILKAPVLRKGNINEYISCVNNTAATSLPDTDNEPELFELVTTYQVHSHSKSCQCTKIRFVVIIWKILYW